MRFEIWRSDEDGQWRARFVAANNEKVWTTEGYERAHGALQACELLAEAFGADLSAIQVDHLGVTKDEAL